jgi:hypothetical protein
MGPFSNLLLSPRCECLSSQAFKKSLMVCSLALVGICVWNVIQYSNEMSHLKTRAPDCFFTKVHRDGRRITNATTCLLDLCESICKQYNTFDSYSSVAIGGALLFGVFGVIFPGIALMMQCVDEVRLSSLRSGLSVH